MISRAFASMRRNSTSSVSTSPSPNPDESKTDPGKVLLSRTLTRQISPVFPTVGGRRRSSAPQLSQESLEEKIKEGDSKALSAFLERLKLDTANMKSSLIYPILRTILASVCFHGNIKTLDVLFKFLLKNPAHACNPTDTPVPLSKRALMIVCRNDHASLIPTLIRSRALLELFYTPLEKSKDSHSSQRRHSLFSLNAVVDEEVTPLHISSGSGSIACLKVLVDDFNYDVNLRTDTGETPLHYACCNNQPEAVAFLIKKGANTNLCDVDGCNALFMAAESKAPACLSQILKKTVSNATTKRCITTNNVQGYSPLHAAAQAGCEESTKLLVEHGASIGMRTSSGDTPILSSCKSDNILSFKILLKSLKKELKSKEELRYVMNRMVNSSKRRAIDIAARKGSVQIMTELLKLGVSVDAFRYNKRGSSRRQREEDFQLEEKDDDEEKAFVDDFEMRTRIADKKSIKLCPLSLAAEKGNTQCIYLLLSAGADVNEASGDDNTLPIMCAVRYLRANAVKLLLRSGCDVTLSNRRGFNLETHLDIFLPPKNRLCDFNYTFDTGQGATGGVSRASSASSDTSPPPPSTSPPKSNFRFQNSAKGTSDVDEKEVDNLSKLRGSRRKVLKLIKLSREGWSEGAYKVWTRDGRRVSDLVTTGVPSSSSCPSLGNLPSDCRAAVMSYLVRADWVKRGIYNPPEGGEGDDVCGGGRERRRSRGKGT